MDSFGNQLKQLARRLIRTPMFTFITLLTLAVSIGANTAVFTVLDSVLLKPLPYPHAGQLVALWLKAPGINISRLSLSPSTYFILHEQGHSFQSIGLYDRDSVSVTGVSEPEQVSALDVTEDTLQTLGIPPMLGRYFNHADDTSGSPQTVILTYGYWQRKFGADPHVIGRTLMADGVSHQIIGVMPQRFHFLDADDVQLFFPFQFERAKAHLGNYSFDGVARLKPGVTLDNASAEISQLLPVVLRSFPAPEGFSIQLFEKANISPMVFPFKDNEVGDIGKLLWVLMGSIGIVLLIACANVANLLLVRFEGRQHELAIRAALGAGWRRIAGELLLESVILGLLGSVLGLALAFGAVRALVAAAPEGLPRLHEIGISVPVLVFTLVVSLLASLLFGAIPIFKYAGSRLGTGLREAGRAASQTRERHRARNVLVVVQVSLAIVLMISSGLMIRTFRAMTRVNPGFASASTLQTFRVTIPPAEISDDEKAIRQEDAILQKLASIPGVQSVAAASHLPMDGTGSFDPVFAQDRAYKAGEFPPVRRFQFIAPNYFSTWSTPLLLGREFTWQDIYNKLPVAIVSENFAREYWQSPQNAMGKRIRVSSKDDWREIVGVASDVRFDGVSQPAPTVAYWPIMVANFESDKIEIQRGLDYVIRSPRAGSESFMNEVREAVWSVDANLPVAGASTEQVYYGKSLARTSFTLIMLVVAGAMALLLGIVGLYGVIAYSVSQRTREIGIRMALGAQQSNLVTMFVRHALVLAAVGVVFGLSASVALMRLMSSLLFEVKPVDPVTYAVVTLCLVATAALASWLPSRRAAAVDPVEALRAE
ncbi:MAG TPA: ABC transporter permease [Candidatus Acidoferrales bacterium]|nr:ABC transporter permease [Candidatus Acidoferrales bacterium]